MLTYRFDDALATHPVIAILRGLRPEQAVEVGAALMENGIRILEVPLNSPEPLRSVRLLRDALGKEAIVGAGTVTTVAQVREVAQAGGELVVSPNANPQVIRETVRAGLVSVPGVATPSEAFAALEAGAHALKAFPAASIGARGIAAWLSVLPSGTRVIAVGGVDAGSMTEYRQAGVCAFGAGASLYQPGFSAQEVGRRARDLYYPLAS